ncbi:743_t:CDS:2, partial [Scutellospora calospora]
VYHKHRSQIGSNKWIIQECLKQKLTNRADNFRKKSNKTKPRITQNLNNYNELEISIQQNIEKISNANKENMSINFKKEFCESDGNNLEDEDCSGSFFSTYATPNNYIALDSDECIDPTPNGHIASTPNSDNILKPSMSIKQTIDKISSRTRQKAYINSKKYNQSLESSLPKRIQKEDTQLPLQSTSNNRLQEIQNVKISNKT